MEEFRGAESFLRLPVDEQARVRTTGQQMVRLAEAHAVPVVYGPPAWMGGEINGATGCVVLLDKGHFIVTASHVLEGYETRLTSAERLVWQVGRFGFDPLPRVAWRNPERDVAFIAVSAGEASQVGSSIISVPMGWPPPKPQAGHFVLVSGFPKVLREYDSSGTVRSGPVSAMLRVAAVGDGYFACQVEREHLISFNEGPPPALGTDLGGLSGAPVFVVGTLCYPFVGVVSQFQENFELLRVADFSDIDL